MKLPDGLSGAGLGAGNGNSLWTWAGRDAVKEIGCFQNCRKSRRQGFEVRLLPESPSRELKPQLARSQMNKPAPPPRLHPIPPLGRRKPGSRAGDREVHVHGALLAGGEPQRSRHVAFASLLLCVSHMTALSHWQDSSVPGTCGRSC